MWESVEREKRTKTENVLVRKGKILLCYKAPKQGFYSPYGDTGNRVPGALRVFKPEWNGRAWPIYHTQENERLTRSLLAIFRDSIDEIFGEGTTSSIHLVRTIVWKEAVS